MVVDARRMLPLVAICSLLAAIGLIETKVHLDLTGPGWDAASYWGAWQGQMYDGAVGTPGHFLYSPAFAQAIWPLTHAPWPVFAWFFISVNALGLAWLLRPLPLSVAVPLWLAGSQEVFSGNIFIPMAIAAVVGMRFPHLWAFVALTKITPCLGPIWFTARGEWAAVAKSLGTTFAVVAVSWLLAPDLWNEWFGFLVEQFRIADGAVGYSFIPGPLYRFPVAIGLVIYAARTQRTWLLPVAMVLATPFIWNGSLTLIAAIPPTQGLRERDSSRSSRRSTRAASFIDDLTHCANNTAKNTMPIRSPEAHKIPPARC